MTPERPKGNKEATPGRRNPRNGSGAGKQKAKAVNNEV